MFKEEVKNTLKEILNLIIDKKCVSGVKELLYKKFQSIYDTAVDIGKHAERTRKKRGYIIKGDSYLEYDVYMSREDAELAILEYKKAIAFPVDDEELKIEIVSVMPYQC